MTNICTTVCMCICMRVVAHMHACFCWTQMDICKPAKGIRKFAVGVRLRGRRSHSYPGNTLAIFARHGMGRQYQLPWVQANTIYKLKRHFNGYFRSLTVRNIRFCKVLGFFYLYALPIHSMVFFFSILWDFYTFFFMCIEYWKRWMDWPYLFNRVFRVLLPLPIKPELITWPTCFLALSRGLTCSKQYGIGIQFSKLQ